MLEVYALNIGRPLSADDKEMFLRQVSEEKRCKVARYRQEMDGQRTLVGEVLMKVMLAEHLALNVKAIVFKKNEFGKPYLEGNPLYFNLSHSGEWIVGAISSQPVGIDVEQIKKADLGIAKSFFAPSEHKALMEIEDEKEKNEAFYMLWSGKESYIKMIGKGLTIPLEAFSLRYNQHKLQLVDAYEEKKAYFTTYPLQQGSYSFVVCHEGKVCHSTYQEVTIQTLYTLLQKNRYF